MKTLGNKNKWKIRLIPLDQIQDNPFQPRKSIRDNELHCLADSISAHGIITPVTVRPVGTDAYQVLAGSRRLAACRYLKFKTIPAVVRKLSDKDATQISLLENIQHTPLTSVETTEAFNLMACRIPEFSREELASRLGIEMHALKDYAATAKTSPLIREALLSGLIIEEHVSILDKLDSSIQLAVLKQVITKKLSVPDTLKLIQRYKHGQGDENTATSQASGSVAVTNADSSEDGKDKKEVRASDNQPLHDPYRMSHMFLSDLRMRERVNFQICSDLLDVLQQEAEDRPDDFLDLGFSYRKDEHIAVHGVNTAKLGLFLGPGLGLSEQESRYLALASFLHDAGLALLPPHLVDFRGEVAPIDIEKLRDHPRVIYRLIEKWDMDPAVSKACLEHHERIDGKGFPEGRFGTEISKITLILQILDLYASLIAPRGFHVPMLPRHAMQTIRNHAAMGRVDENTFAVFAKVMSMYPLGSLVRLSTGEIARVTRANHHAVATPCVRTVLTPEGMWTRTKRALDLSQEKEITIIAAVSDELLPGLN